MYFIITIWFLQEICSINSNGVYGELAKAIESFNEIVRIEKCGKIPTVDAPINTHTNCDKIVRLSPDCSLVLARHVYNANANYRACILLFQTTAKAE